MTKRIQNPVARDLFIGGAIALLYYVAARMGLYLAFSHPNVSPLWPPAGLALAALLIGGIHFWPAVLAGASAAAFSTGVSFLVALGIAAGNTLAAVVGTLLVRRFAGNRNPLDTAGNVIRFVLLAGFLSTTISATNGVTILSVEELMGDVDYFSLWRTWLIGDMIGIVIVGSAILSWKGTKAKELGRRKILETIYIVAIVLFVSVTIFWDVLIPTGPLTYAVIPFVVLAGYRLEQRGVTAALLVLSVASVIATTRGFGPFASVGGNESLVQLQIFLGITALTGLILASVVIERSKVEAALRTSEGKYRALSEHIPVVTYVAEFGTGGQWVYVSPQIKSILGFSPQEWTSTPGIWQKQMHPEDRASVMEQETKAQSSGKIFHAQYRMFTREGKLIWVEDDGVVVRDQNPPRFYQGILQDITQRKMAEEELRKSQTRHEELVNSIDGIVWEADVKTFQFTFISRQAERILGWPQEWWLNEPTFWRDHVHPEDREEAASFYLRSTQEKKDHEFEYRMLAADGGIVWIRDIVSVVIQDGDAIALRGLMIDITARKEAEALQSAMYRIAEKTSEAVGMEDLVQAIHSIVGELMYAKNFYIALRDESSGKLTLPYFVDEKDKDIDPEQLGQGLTAYVFGTGEPLLASPERLQQLMSSGDVDLVGSAPVDWLGVPLKSGEQTIGVLAVQSYQEEVRYGKREVEILTFVSRHIAAALERKRADKALRVSEERYRLFFEEDISGDFVAAPDGAILSSNPAFARMLGYAEDESIVGENWFSYASEDDSEEFLLTLREEKRFEKMEVQLRKRNGDPIFVEENIIGIFDDSGNLLQFRGYLFDVTERKQLEQQLSQAQKIKAIGQLAGGVAHDFNNILMAITGYTELLRLRLGDHHPHISDVLEIQKSAERGAALTHQLLAFSRKQVLEPKILDLGQVLSDMENMLRRLIREDIVLKIIHGDVVGLVRADPGQLEQVIVNLAVNARDAMPQGGVLTMEISDFFMDEAFVHHNLGSEMGRYVLFAVSDTGVGMDVSTQSRIFEPFFSTKEKGKGSGLGLATSYGIVKQSGGYITVYSEVGKGSTFKIYLPRVDGPAEVVHGVSKVHQPSAAGKTILLVDDSDSVRNAVGTFLELQGYAVLQAGDGVQAFDLLKKADNAVDLLITDMVMPQMSGPELVRRSRTVHPELKVLFISGYTEEVAIRSGDLDKNSSFLSKPASMEAILRKIHEVME